MLGWCESSYSDVTLLLRREGFFSYMMLRHDLQIIMANPGARPNIIQMKIINEIGNFIILHFIPMIEIFLFQLRTLS